MSRDPRGVRSRLLAGLSGLSLSVGMLAGVPAAAIAGGVMTPAVGAQPQVQVVGRARPGDPRVFGCQTATPPTCYGPSQIRAAYGVNKIQATGAGETIVIIDAFQSPTIQHDLDLFDSIFELPAATVQIIAPDGLTPFDQADDNMVGWAGEITLDVEWAHAIAPGARIALVLAKSNEDADILSATRYAIDHNLGDVISQSFGEAETCVDPRIERQQHRAFEKATARGITLIASSGDQGSAQPTCDGTTYAKAASSPASDPNVTAVGGTELAADGTTGAYHGEVTWNEPQYGAASGGGYSLLYDRPAYQKGAVHKKARGVPDVSYNAGIDTGVLAAWSTSGLGADLVFRFGGTSAGSPQWAGLVALADQLNRGHRVGAINDELYAIARSAQYSKDFHDITSGNNTYHGDVKVKGFKATVGWDAATGLGSPVADKLVKALYKHL